jgi:hypothetical protein
MTQTSSSCHSGGEARELFQQPYVPIEKAYAGAGAADHVW